MTDYVQPRLQVCARRRRTFANGIAWGLICGALLAKAIELVLR